MSSPRRTTGFPPRTNPGPTPTSAGPAASPHPLSRRATNSDAVKEAVRDIMANGNGNREGNGNGRGRYGDEREGEEEMEDGGDSSRIGPFVIGREVGKGSFAVVHKGYREKTRSPVAIKIVSRVKLTPRLLDNLEGEISILKGIRHKNIVELVDCLKTKNHIYLVMAYCSAGDLSVYIKQKGRVVGLSSSSSHQSSSSSRRDQKGKGRVQDDAGAGEEEELYPHPKEGGLNEVVVRCFLGQLAQALEFLRAKNIVHRDIKPQNLLLDPADPASIAAGHPVGIPILRVADFGFARHLEARAMAETLCGSPLYMAPEILRYEKYDAKADLWSVGAVLYEMCVGKAPFRAQNHIELLRKIERGEDRIKFPDEKVSSVPSAGYEDGNGAAGGRGSGGTGAGEVKVSRVADDIKDLIRRLLKRGPMERMAFDDFFVMSKAVAQIGPPPSSSFPPASPTQPYPTRQNSNAGGGQAQIPATSNHLRQRSSASSPPSPVAQPSSSARPGLTPAVSNPNTDLPPFARTPSSSNQPPTIGQGGRRTSYSSSTNPRSNPDRNSFEPPSGGGKESPPIPQPPTSLARRPSSFAPKYVVGGGAAAREGSSTSPSQPPQPPTLRTDVKSRDYAVSSPSKVSGNNMKTGGGLAGTTGIGAIITPPPDLAAFSPGGGGLSGGEGTTKKTRHASIDNSPGASGGNIVDRDSDQGEEDMLLGKEYVMVEKKNVEINALADELASAQRKPQTLGRKSSRGFLSRNPSTLAPVSVPGAAPASNPYPPSSTHGNVAAAYDFPPPPFAITRRESSPHGLYGSSPKSAPKPSLLSGSPRSLGTLGGIVNPSAAFAKAISYGQNKLFGSPHERYPADKRGGSGGPRKPISRSTDILDPAEDKLLAELEDLARKASVILEFADTKISQILPPTPQTSSPSTMPSYFAYMASRDQQVTQANSNPFASSDQARARRPSLSSLKQPQGVNITGAGTGGGGTYVSMGRQDVLAAEAMVLYIRALAFLQLGIEKTTRFWTSKSATVGQQGRVSVSADFNDAVQWLRSSFNECFEKADFAKTRCQEEIPDSATAEKLIYDRALDMSRTAAVNELKNGSPAECEAAYETALWMLYTLLDESVSGPTGFGSGDFDGGEDLRMDEENRAIIEKFITSIKSRMNALRKKIASNNNNGGHKNDKVVSG